MPDDDASPASIEAARTLLTTSDFLKLLGLHFDNASSTRVTGWFEAGPHLHTPFGVLHGGVLCSVVETFGSVGAWLSVRDSGRQVYGVANATDFLRSTVSGRLDVVATAVYQGRSLELWDVVISRAVDGKDVARGRLRLQVVAPR